MAWRTLPQNPRSLSVQPKYDALLRHETSRTGGELRAPGASMIRKKGKCARCHQRPGERARFISSSRTAATPRFGAPRNSRGFPPNAGPHVTTTSDCGGPLRTGLGEKKGVLRFVPFTPTCAIVATGRGVSHNGVFHRLEDVVRFTPAGTPSRQIVVIRSGRPVFAVIECEFNDFRWQLSRQVELLGAV